MKYYTVYDNKTDRVVAFGRAEECTQMLGLKSVACFYSIVSKSHRRKKYSVVVTEGDDAPSDT